MMQNFAAAYMSNLMTAHADLRARSLGPIDADLDVIRIALGGTATIVDEYTVQGGHQYARLIGANGCEVVIGKPFGGVYHAHLYAAKEDA